MFISEGFLKSLFGSTDEFAKPKTESRGQRIGDLNSYIDLAQLDGADICAVDIGAFCKILLGGLKSLPGNTDRSAKSESRESGCLRHAILLVS